MFKRLRFASIAIVAVLSAFGVANAATTPRDADALAKATYIYIATVRKDGNQSKAAPVWFIASDNQVFIDTNFDSWKAKRIKRGSPVLVWIGSETGPAFIGNAEIVQDPALQDMMIKEIPNKYLLAERWTLRPEPRKIRFRKNCHDSDLAAARPARGFSISARNPSAKPGTRQKYAALIPPGMIRGCITGRTVSPEIRFVCI